MPTQSATAIAYLLANEGGFVNDPLDRGAATKYGITQATLASWRGKPQSTNDVKSLTAEQATAIYKARFYDALHLDRVGSVAVATAVLDMAALTGPQTAVKRLQACLNVLADGQMGPITIAAVNASDRASVLPAFAQSMQAYFLSIVRRDATQSRFLWGWLCRASKLMLLAF